MAIKSEAQKRAVAKYDKNNYDSIRVRVPKGMKEVIQNHAQKYQVDGSVNAFIKRAISETMERDTKK